MRRARRASDTGASSKKKARIKVEQPEADNERDGEWRWTENAEAGSSCKAFLLPGRRGQAPPLETKWGQEKLANLSSRDHTKAGLPCRASRDPAEAPRLKTTKAPATSFQRRGGSNL